MIYKQFLNLEMSQSPGLKYAFVLGRETEICFSELISVLHAYGIDFSIFGVCGNIVYILTEKEIDCTGLIWRLAGTTKIFELQSPFSNSQFDKPLSNFALDLYKKLPDFRRNFALSYYGNYAQPRKINQIGLKLKFELKNSGYPVRFIGLKEDAEVSTIISARETSGDKGLEIGIFENNNFKFFGILVAVNDPRPWSQRDYEKPAGDKYSGMLPPKLARTMINLATGSAGVSLDDIKSVSLWDPFCGSGNVLIESFLLGIDFVGTDLSDKAVSDSKENIEWIKENSGKFKSKNSQKFQIEKADATDSKTITDHSPFLAPKNSILIVTEPFLGIPKKYPPSMAQAFEEYSEIKKVYLNFLKNFKQLGKPAIFCIVFPSVETLNRTNYSLYQNSVDEIKKIGYTELRPPLLYGRNYQIVKRELVFLKLT